MFGIYFSGTGNTKCYIEKLMKALDKRLGALLRLIILSYTQRSIYEF